MGVKGIILIKKNPPGTNRQKFRKIQNRNNIMKLKKLLPCLLAFAVVPALADALSTTPKRVGPVSHYGALHTSGSKIIGSKNNEQAMLRGISLFWSDATGQPYYKPSTISWAVSNLKIDVFRFAMGVQYYDSDGGTTNAMQEGYSYKSAPDGFLNLLDKMVAAAIENDVYIIVDWHSHRAHLESALAKAFFEKVAEKYKDVPNIIYEIFNEPVSGNGGDWGSVKSYANTICPVIRKSTQNLIIVGTPNWSQHPENGARDPVNSTNIAYVLHFYAAEHPKGSFSGNIDQALSAGSPVFISEWGTTKADGNGNPSESATNDWTSYMDQNMIPNCNWSFRQATSPVDKKSEQSAFFEGSEILFTAKDLNNATYTASGNIVKNYLVKNGRSWADSLVKGKNTGNCAFKSTTAMQTDGQIAGVLKAGCTYTSSDENVVTVEGSNIIIKDYGYAVLAGDDGSESVVTIEQVEGQTIPGFMDVQCNYTNSCRTTNGSDRALDFDGDGNKEYLLGASNETDQGSPFTLTSLDPAFKIKNAVCSNSACSNTQSGKKVWMIEFSTYTTGKIVATAPATDGFRAMNDTITVTYEKGQNSISMYFKNKTLALGATGKDMAPDTTIARDPITYTFNGKDSSPYLTKDGNNLVAGNQNALVYVEAHAQETANYKEFTKGITITIGDANAAVNIDEYNAAKNPVEAPVDDAVRPIQVKTAGLTAQIIGNTIQFSNKKAGVVKVSTYDAIGNRVMENTDIYNAGSHMLPLEDVARGSYVTVISQESQKATLRWNKQ